MKCSNCGAELRPGDKFCTKCGTKVEAPVSTDQQPNTNESNNNQASNVNNADFTNGSGNQNIKWNQNKRPQPELNQQTQNANFNKQVPPVQQTVSTKSNATVNALKQNSMGYFNWFKSTLAEPSKIQETGKYNGIISIIINALILAASIYVVGNQVLSALADAFNKFLTLGGNSQQIEVNASFVFYLKAFVAMIVFFAIFILIGYACKKYLMNSQESITTYINTFATFSNGMIVAEIVLAIYLLIAMPGDVSALTESASGLMIFLTILLAAIFGIFVTSYILSILYNSTKVKMDKIYVAAIGLFASNVIVYFIFKFFINTLFSKGA